MDIILSREFSFDSAQKLDHFPEGHKCKQLHGHTFRLVVSVKGPVDESTGMLYDHAEIAKVVRPLVEQLDHAYLNDIPGLEKPTIENISRWLWQKIHPSLPHLHEIELHETLGAWCRYQGN